MHNNSYTHVLKKFAANYAEMQLLRHLFIFLKAIHSMDVYHFILFTNFLIYYKLLLNDNDAECGSTM